MAGSKVKSPWFSLLQITLMTVFSLILKWLNKMGDKLFLPIHKLRFTDLFDWSDPTQRCKTKHVTIMSPSKRRNAARNHGCLNHGTLTEANDEELALFRYGKKVFAIKEDCPHAGGPLHLGDIEEIDDAVCVKCPWHGWKMDLETGKIVHPSGHDLQSTLTYPVKVKDNGNLYIGFDGLNEKYFKIDYNF